MKNIDGLKLGHGWNKGIKALWSCGEKNYNWNGGKQTFECLFCGALFLDRKTKNRTPKFCRHKCFSDHRKAYGTLRGINHPNWGKSMPSSTGSKNVNWKGDDVSYYALHHWLNRYIKKCGVCKLCGKSKETKDGRSYTHLANRSHKYLRDVNDYIELCPSCNLNYDYGNISIEGGISP